MARLYAYLESDRAKQAKTVSGNEVIAVHVKYGSKANSILAVRVRVEWKEGEEKPTVYVYPIEVADVKVCQNR